MKNRVAALAAILSLAAPVAGRAAPPAAPAPAPPPMSSSNVHLVTTLPTGTGVGGKFVGHHYFQTTARPGGYVPGGASTGGVVSLDVTNPEQPTPAGFLPLPIWQNEDVDVSATRNVLLVVADRRKSVSQVATSPIVGGILFVVDIANPNAPVLKSTLQLPAQVATAADGTPLGGPGHTATCILGCNYAYLSGSRDRSVHVVDLRNLAAPSLLGTVRTPAAADNEDYAPGVVHDVNVDRTGHVWIVGSGGTALYAPIKDPLKPKLLASVAGADNTRLNQLIHHGSIRLDANTVLVGEESFDAWDCGGSDGASGPQDGSFQTWKIDLKRKRLAPLDTWDADKSTLVTDVDENAGSGCSSHWFDLNTKKVVADAWYGQGLRFLDVSNPKKIRQVGFWLGPNAAAGQAQFVPGRPDLVYVADYDRGLDVVKIDNAGAGAPTVQIPPASRRRAASQVRFAPDPDFGYACLVPVV